MRENILITGSTGFLGENLIKYLKKTCNFYYLLNKRKPKKLSVKSFITYKSKKYENIEEFIIKNSINTIIHCAGLTNIEFCEQNPKKCFEVNYELTKYLTNISKRLKLYMVFISSDHLFKGNEKIYTEVSKYSPQNNYAASKVKCEKFIKKNLNNFLIIRTNFFGFQYKKNKKNFFNFIYKNLKNNSKVKLFSDVYYTPISIFTLSKTIKIMLNKKLTGIYNLSSDTSISKFEFGKLVSKIFKFNFKLINKISIKDLNLVKRPHNMSLDNTKIKKELNIKKINIYDEIKMIKKDFNANR